MEDDDLDRNLEKSRLIIEEMMEKKIKQSKHPSGIWAMMGYAVLALGCFGAVALLVLNLLNPDFTETRMFFEFWPIYLGSYLCMGLAALFLSWGTSDDN